MNFAYHSAKTCFEQWQETLKNLSLLEIITHKTQQKPFEALFPIPNSSIILHSILTDCQQLLIQKLLIQTLRTSPQWLDSESTYAHLIPKIEDMLHALEQKVEECQLDPEEKPLVLTACQKYFQTLCAKLQTAFLQKISVPQILLNPLDETEIERESYSHTVLDILLDCMFELHDTINLT